MERRSSETRAESVVRGAVEADPDDEYLVGLAGTLEGGDSYLLSVGIGVRDLRRIIFTHQDLDHVGSGAALVRQSSARVLAHPADAPYIEGELRPLKVTPEMLERRPQMREVLERLETVAVDEQVEDGTRLNLAGGTKVISTPGHICLYLEQPKVLIAGDALTAEDGSLNGPNPSMTPQMGTAIQSIRRLAELDVDTIVCYHGGVVSKDANGQLRRVVRKASRDGDEKEQSLVPVRAKLAKTPFKPTRHPSRAFPPILAP